MLSPEKVAASPPHGGELEDGNGLGIDVEKVFAVVRRQWRIVALGVIVASLTGLAYTLTAVPLYTATASLLIDRGNNGLVKQLTMDDMTIEDEASIFSQVEVLKSETIGLAVVDNLGLSDNSEFVASTASLASNVRNLLSKALDASRWFTSKGIDGELSEKRRRQALGQILNNMQISRVGRSYVLSVSYTSASPVLASQIATGIADAYIVDKLNSKYDATRRASDWLQTRIEELKQSALNTDLAVQKFRADNGLLNSGTNGQLITDQQLSELNSALITAQSETAKARAKYDRIQQIIQSGQSDAIVTDVLDSSISNELRQKYLAASKLEAEISSRLGENHVRAVQLRNEMSEYRRLMFEELNRIAESYKSELDVAQARERDLHANLDKAKNQSAVAGETGVQLRELERSADTYRNLYQTFLQRYQEAMQQQSFPITEARIITRPETPTSPSYPQKGVTITLFAVFGALIGAAAGSLREFRDRFFRTGQQVREELNLEFLGIAPIIATAVRTTEPNADRGSHLRTISRVNNTTDYVVEHPLSAFAETLRSAKIAIDIEGTAATQCAKVVGVVSTLPGEGKSTISSNLAELLAMQGARVLLIDCDLRNPGATRALARHANAGLMEVLTGAASLKDLLLLNEKTGLAFLPAVVKRRVPHSSELLASEAMNALLESAKAKFDYVILDLPPLAPVVDARAIAGRVDEFIFVIEWGRSSRKVVRQTLERSIEVFNRCAGVILNKVDNKKMKLYRAHGSTEYYYSTYISYYNDNN